MTQEEIPWTYKRLHDQEHGSSLLFLHLESYKIFDLGLFGFLLSHSWAVSEQPWKRMESEETTRSKMK
jgi:hypothetical protein